MMLFLKGFSANKNPGTESRQHWLQTQSEALSKINPYKGPINAQHFMEMSEDEEEVERIR